METSAIMWKEPEPSDWDPSCYKDINVALTFEEENDRMSLEISTDRKFN
jgi:hypothetical protein